LQSTHYKDFKAQPNPSLRIATYNLFWKNGTCAMNHPNSTSRLIKIVDADILLLQEVTPKLERCLTHHLAKKYPYHQFRFYEKEGGLAIMSKYPFTTKNFIIPIHGWFPAWITNVHSPIGNLQILNLHLRPQVLKGDGIGVLAHAVFTTPKIREAEIKQFYPYLTFGQPTIIAGDFNEGGHGRAVKFLRKHGFYDAMARHSQYTWKHQYGPITLAKKYDRIFLSPHFRLKQVQVLHESSSDHYPVVVDVSSP